MRKGFKVKEKKMKCVAMILTLCIFLGTSGIVTSAFGQETKTEALLMYLAEKKTDWVGAAASLTIPSLGHAYAQDWWPRGAKFLGLYAGSIVLIAIGLEEIGVLGLIGCRIWEVADAYWAVQDYNRKLAKRYGVELSLYRDKPYLHFCYRF